MCVCVFVCVCVGVCGQSVERKRETDGSHSAPSVGLELEHS